MGASGRLSPHMNCETRAKPVLFHMFTFLVNSMRAKVKMIEDAKQMLPCLGVLLVYRISCPSLMLAGRKGLWTERMHEGHDSSMSWPQIFCRTGDPEIKHYTIGNIW